MKIKNFFIILLVVVLSFFATTYATAHSGRTDSKGGHYDHSTGEYHYHHGKPAHDHPNGICPYKQKENVVTSNDTKTESKTFFELCYETFNHYIIIAIINGCCFGLMLVKFQKLNLFHKYLFFKFFWCPAIISFISVLLADFYEEISLKYIISAIGLVVLIFVSYWPISKMKYKKFHNQDFMKIYYLVDKTRQHEESFFYDWVAVSEEELGIYHSYTCYVSKTSNTVHYKKGCSNAHEPSHLLKTNGPLCKKCAKSKRNVLLEREIYNRFIDVCDVLNFWNIKPI